jgi:hypothetical protein
MSDFPRAMTDVEHGVLEFLLQPGVPGVEALRDQARHAEVTWLCECGCPTFDLAVDKSQTTRAEIDSKTEPIVWETSSVDLDPPIDLLLFVRDRWLEMVELVWYGDHPPSMFPAMSHFAWALRRGSAGRKPRPLTLVPTMTWLGGIVGAIVGFGIGLLITEVIVGNSATGSGFDWQFWTDILLAVVGALTGAAVARRLGNRSPDVVQR